jgi:hypothetical protein
MGHEAFVAEAAELVAYDQHTSAYVSIRQHMGHEAFVAKAAELVAYGQHTPAYVSIRQHTSAYERSKRA